MTTTTATPLLQTLVKQHMREVVTVVTASMHLRAAARLFGERGISAAPVVDEAWQPIGVVSQTDLLRRGPEAPARAGTAGYYVLVHGEPLLTASVPAVAGDEAPDGVVGDVMTRSVLAVAEDAHLETAVRLLVAHSVHRVLVRNEAGKLTGVLSSMDVLRALVPEAAALRATDGF